MSKFLKRYLICAVIILLIICILYYYFINGRDSDEFISVSYVSDDDEIISSKNNWNENELLNLTNFRYINQPTKVVCRPQNDELFAILLVTSYVSHDQVRSAHRTAISNSDLHKLNIVRVFLLAEIPSKEKFITQEAINNEHDHFNDIVQGNFIESYRNLPYKHVMGLRYAASHPCLKPKYIIKMDDDIVVDLFHLIKYLKQHESKFAMDQHFLAGYIFRNVIPIREKQNKWFVSKDEFDGSMYPDYLSGWMYVTMPFTAKSLVMAAADRTQPIFWIDDTWITGILRQKQQIPINDMLNDMFSANSQFLDCCLNDLKKSKFQCPFIAGPNGGDHKMIQQFMQTIKSQCYEDSVDIMIDKCIERDAKLPPLKMTCIGSDKHLLREDHGAAIISAIRL